MARSKFHKKKTTIYSTNYPYTYLSVIAALIHSIFSLISEATRALSRTAYYLPLFHTRRANFPPNTTDQRPPETTTSIFKTQPQHRLNSVNYMCWKKPRPHRTSESRGTILSPEMRPRQRKKWNGGSTGDYGRDNDDSWKLEKTCCHCGTQGHIRTRCRQRSRAEEARQGEQNGRGNGPNAKR